MQQPEPHMEVVKCAASSYPRIFRVDGPNKLDALCEVLCGLPPSETHLHDRMHQYTFDWGSDTDASKYACLYVVYCRDDCTATMVYDHIMRSEFATQGVYVLTSDENHVPKRLMERDGTANHVLVTVWSQYDMLLHVPFEAAVFYDSSMKHEKAGNRVITVSPRVSATR